MTAGNFFAFAAALAAVISLPGAADAKLASTKAQEAAMIAKIVPVTDKWLRRVNDQFDKSEPFAAEIAAMARDICPLENGIFNDIYVCSDLSRLCVYAQKKDAHLYRALDDFDAGANQLCADDRVRYYTAKARLLGEKLACPDSLKQDWLSRIAGACATAARIGFDADKGLGIVRKFAERSGIKEGLDEPSCRIYREYAAFFLTKAKSQGKSMAAFETALAAVREIPATSLTDAGACGQQKSEAERLSAYDRTLVQPLSTAVGRNRDAFLVEVCKKFWQQKKLVTLVLPRLSVPSPDAFDLFKKAGEDDALKAEPRIAVAELSLWKKAGKLREFKKTYPDRYRLGRSAVGL
jgi:hypothetical protein